MPWHMDEIHIAILRFKQNVPWGLLYKAHFSRQLNCWSLRCSWSIACRRCSNYIFILNLIPGFNGLGKDSNKMRREAFQFWDLVRLILETLLYITLSHSNTQMPRVRAWLRGTLVGNIVLKLLCTIKSLFLENTNRAFDDSLMARMISRS